MELQNFCEYYATSSLLALDFFQKTPQLMRQCYSVDQVQKTTVTA